MKYHTPEKTISCSREKVYTVLSDFHNLERFQDKVPEGTPSFSVVDSDRCEVELPMAGSLTLTFKEKSFPDKIILCNAPSPLPIQFEITMSLKAKSENETSFSLELDLDLPGFVLAMVGEKKINKSLEKIAHIFTIIPYDQINA